MQQAEQLTNHGLNTSSSKIFLFTEFRWALGPTQPIQWVLEEKWPGHEADYSTST
jgi:hypothetical protein